MTIDFWIHYKDLPGDGTYRGIMGQYESTNTYWGLSINNTGGTYSYVMDAKKDGVSVFNVSAAHSGVATGNWYHIAVIRPTIDYGLSYAIDGTYAVGVPSDFVWPDINGTFRIGSAYNSTTGTTVYHSGYIDEVRVTKGAARWTASFTPPSVRYGSAYVLLSAGEVACDLTGFVASTDSQVTHIELWRTQANGSAYFLVTRLANSTAAYEDQTGDTDLGNDELPTDNLKPYYWFDDAEYHNASMFWITRTRAGEKGRVYYSPIGRSEAVQGFINVADDARPLMKLVRYGTALGVFGEDGFYEILGENPYYSRKVPGVPGTIEPQSVAITPYGIAYEAADGPRLLTGTQAAPLGKGTVDRIFQGEAVLSTNAWTTGTQGTYARGEYIMTNAASSATIACDLQSQRWRELGLDLGSIYYASDADKIAAYHVGTTLSVYEIEKEGTLDDNSAAIVFQTETKHFNIPSQQEVLIRNVFVDYETSRTVTFGLQYDHGTSKNVVQTGLAGGTRRTVELPYNVWAKDFGLRAGATAATGDLKIYGIDFDVYIPNEERE